MNKATRRARQTAGHLIHGNDEVHQLSQSASGSADGGVHISKSSYARIHGNISRAPAKWEKVSMKVAGKQLEETIYEKAEGIAKLTINRPKRRNAFTPRTVLEMISCLEDARNDGKIGVVILTGKGSEAFCSGGDQGVRSVGGYVGEDGVPRLNFLDLQNVLRRLPKPVIAMVAGYAVGGGHILHMLCDITVSSDNAIYGQTGPKVGSFDAGYGCTQMSRLVGTKKAREMWFLAKLYTAQEAMEMGLVNTVVPLEKLESETVYWCRQMLANSPMALSVLKASMNAADDGHAGIQELGGLTTKLFYSHEQGLEGLNAYLEKRKPDFHKFRK